MPASGITPLRALAEGLTYAPGRRRPARPLHATDPLFAREFDLLARERGSRSLWLPGRRRRPDSWLGPDAGRVTTLTALRYWVPDIAERDVFLCGPTAWTDRVRTRSLAAGVPRDPFHTREPWMVTP